MDGHEEREINGTQPELEGLACEEVLAVQFWHANKLEEPVNVVHLKFGGLWHRLYFDHGIIFWRPDDAGPQAFRAPELQAEYRIDDIGRRQGLIGLALVSIDSETTELGSRVALTFEGERTVTFFDDDDRSGYACQHAAESDGPAGRH